jgi:type II secretory pathway pseudopilin PulG
LFRSIRIRLASERGIATPVVIAVMSVVAMLAAGGALAALGTNEGANEDRRAKRALAAAEAGIQQAAYRLATLRPDQTMCLGASGPNYTASPVGGECTTPVPGTLSPDTSFSYVATPALAAGAACADQPNLASDTTSTDHCITATGISGTVQRRLQARVRVARGGLFSGIGLIGLDLVKMVNSDKIWSDIGSNGLIDGDNSIEVNSGYRLRIPNSAPTPTISGSNPPVVRLSSPWALAQTDFASVAAGNNNSQLASLPSNRWNPTTKMMTFPSGSLTLPGGSYHLCDFYADDSVTVSLQSGATASNPVRIFIDSPSRAGSGCTGTSGRFCLDNSINFNASGNAAALEIYVYGSTSTCGQTSSFNGSSYAENTPVILNNSVNFRGTIYAPTTTVRLNNSVKMDGGIAAQAIYLENSIEFRHPSSLSGAAAAAGPIRRLSWVECRPLPTTASDPESGCS